MLYKYIVLFTVDAGYRSTICRLMDAVAKYTGIAPPYVKLPAHITFHRPIVGIDEETLECLVQSMALQIHQTRIRLGQLDHFGKQFIVLPVIGTRRLNAFWVGINDLLSRLPSYEHGPFDEDNTLHVTIAEKTSHVFDKVWPLITDLRIEPTDIPVRHVEVWRKPLYDIEGRWEILRSFPLAA
jgi:hypothetical protein